MQDSGPRGPEFDIPGSEVEITVLQSWVKRGQITAAFLSLNSWFTLWVTMCFISKDTKTVTVQFVSGKLDHMDTLALVVNPEHFCVMYMT